MHGPLDIVLMNLEVHALCNRLFVLIQQTNIYQSQTNTRRHSFEKTVINNTNCRPIIRESCATMSSERLVVYITEWWPA